MGNPNALISMALVSNNSNNPYLTFCEYIKYCLFSNASEHMGLTELRDAVSTEFGVYLPTNIEKYCLNLLQKDGVTSFCQHQVYRTGTYDTDAFDRLRDEYKATESALVGKLIDFASKYGKTWTYDQARELLIKVLDSSGLAYEIFVHNGDLLDNEDGDPSLVEPEDEVESREPIEGEEEKPAEPLFTDISFVGKYIQKILSSESVEKSYLLKVCEGLMLCVGSYQLPAAGAEPSQTSITHTLFFFDTRLLLRFLGCANESAVKATQELVQMITSSGGSVVYYPQTFDELESAFDVAIDCLSKGYPPNDDEMRIYASRIGNKVTILQSKKASLKNELAAEGIYLRQNQEFDDQDRIHFGFDRNDLISFMRENLSWAQKTIENDALSIWETHMRRRGNYDAYFGMTDDLPVFVTHNSRLFSISLEYKDARQSNPILSKWKPNRLPVITDIRLTCRLWNPSSQSERLSLLYLSSNAIAAQKPSRQYLNKVRSLAIELQSEVPQYSNIPLPSFFDDSVTTKILEVTQGMDEALDIGNFADSIEELTEWRALEQEKLKNKALSERDEINDKFSEQTSAIISGAIIPLAQKKYFRSLIPVFMINNWDLFVAAILGGIGAIVSNLAGGGAWYLVMLSGAVPIIVERVIGSAFVKRKLADIFFDKIETRLNSSIEAQLRPAEHEFKDEILQKVKEKIKCWQSFSKLKK